MKEDEKLENVDTASNHLVEKPLNEEPLKLNVNENCEIKIDVSTLITHDKSFSCTLCEEKFPTAYHLDYHMNCHHSKIFLTGNPAVGEEKNNSNKDILTMETNEDEISLSVPCPKKRKRTSVGVDEIGSDQCTIRSNDQTRPHKM